MIIELVVNDPNSKKHLVRCYNDETVYATTSDLLEAIGVARREATAFDRDALVRVIVGHATHYEQTATTAPSLLLVKLSLLVIASYLFAVVQFFPDIIAEIRYFIATVGNYDGARHRVNLRTEQPAAETDCPTLTCATCLFSQPLAEFQSRGLCNECGNPTCDFCNDGKGYCLECTPYLAPRIAALLPAGTNG